MVSVQTGNLCVWEFHQRANQQKHLGIILDEKLNFKCYIDKILTKSSKGIAAIKRLRNFLPRKIINYYL